MPRNTRSNNKRTRTKSHGNARPAPLNAAHRLWPESKRNSVESRYKSFIFNPKTILSPSPRPGPSPAQVVTIHTIDTGGTDRQIHYPSLREGSSGRARPLSHYMTRVIAPSFVVRILICPFSCACSGRDGSYFSGIFISFFDSMLPKQQLLDGK